MQALAEILGAILAFIFEMLVWSLVGFWKLCHSLFSKKERSRIAELWKKGAKERAMLVVGAAVWLPIFAVGFGLGLPLAYSVIKPAPERRNYASPNVPAEVFLSDPKNPGPSAKQTRYLDVAEGREGDDSGELPGSKVLRFPGSSATRRARGRPSP